MTTRLKVRELQPLHSPEVSGHRPHLRQLTDAELLKACEHPLDGRRLIIHASSGRLMNGNGRAYELKRRAAEGNGTITWKTVVTVDQHSPDNSIFTDGGSL